MGKVGLVAALLALAASCGGGASAGSKTETEPCMTAAECVPGLACYAGCPACAERPAEKRCYPPGATFHCPPCVPFVPGDGSAD
jgi:hypothetical protein